MLQQRFMAELPEYLLSRHLFSAGVVAGLAVVWYVVIAQGLRAFDRAKAEPLLWTELVASGFAALALAFAVWRSIASGLFRGLPVLTAVLGLAALAYAAAFGMQTYMYFTGSDGWLDDWVPASKIGLILAFGVIAFRFTDNARTRPVQA